VLKSKCLALVVAVLFSSSQLAWGATDTVTVTVVVGASSSSISVSPATLDFGTLNPDVSNFRFSAGPISVTYSAIQSADLFVYTDVPADIEGLIGVADPTKTLPLRAWTENYGPGLGGIPPDPQNNTNWNDLLNAVWSPVKEIDVNGKTLLIADALSANDTFDVYLAVDTVGAAPQAYAGTLIFEVLNN